MLRIKYFQDGSLINDRVENEACAHLNRQGFGCQSCNEGLHWSRRNYVGKMFPTSVRDDGYYTTTKCLKPPAERSILVYIGYIRKYIVSKFYTGCNY